MIYTSLYRFIVKISRGRDKIAGAYFFPAVGVQFALAISEIEGPTSSLLHTKCGAVNLVFNMRGLHLVISKAVANQRAPTAVRGHGKVTGLGCVCGGFRCWGFGGRLWKWFNWIQKQQQQHDFK